jgi:hypothetical protein
MAARVADLARARGFENLSIWAELMMEWAEAADAELAMLRPKPGQAHIDGDAVVTAAAAAIASKHPGVELHDAPALCPLPRN